MTVPLFDTRVTYKPLLGELREAIGKVLDSGHFILGPEVEGFEREFAAYLGVGHVVSVANGTEALTIALRALGTRPGDEVVLPSFTFYATAEAVVNAGAQPVFCDIDAATYCITPAAVEEALTDRTRVVVPVHLFGGLAPMDELRELCAPRGIRLLEDSAQAAGARLGERRAGSLGDAATFSFFPSKNLFCFGDGGAITTDDDGVAQLARELRFHGSRDKRSYSAVGYNSRLDAVQAAVLRVLLPHLDGWNERRRRVAAAYAEAGVSALARPPEAVPGAECVHHLYMVGCEDRDDVLKGLREEGVEARAYYATPVHRQPPMASYFEAQGGADLPGTEAAAAANLALPMNPGLRQEQVERVVEGLQAAASRPAAKV